MDVDKLKLLANIKSLSLSKKRALNKIVKEITSKFDFLESLEKTQVLACVLLHKNLEESLKLIGVDTTSKKRKFSNMQSDIIENVKKGLSSLGKKVEVKIRALQEELCCNILFVIV